MSVQAISAVFRHSTTKGAARLVLLALADVANDEGEVSAYKRSHSVLAAKANCDEGTVARAIRTATDAGELVVTAIGDGRRSSDYQIVLPGLGAQDAYPGDAPRTPCPGETRAQGVQDAPPISPSLSVERSVPHVPPTASAEPGEQIELTIVAGGLSPMTKQQQIESVFAAWIDATGKTTRTLLDGRRTRIIAKALDLYPLDDVTAAVRGWRHSAHHRGENGTRTVYNDLELLLRDPQHIERFRDLEVGALPAVAPAMSRTANTLRAWAGAS